MEMGSRLNKECISAILRIADIRPPQEIALLDRPSNAGSLALSSEDVEAARLLLVNQRRSKPNYKPPETRLRHRFSSSRLKEKQRNPVNWTFSKHEVAKTIDSLLAQPHLPRSTVAHAVWAHQSLDSLDELWCHLHDAELEKRTASRFRRSKSSVPPPMTWLSHVTTDNQLDYIDLMCQAGVSQDSLDNAFGIALSDRNFDAMEILLGYGASASTHLGIIHTRMEMDDVVLARLLLSVPRAMSTQAWQACLEPQLKSYPAILHLVLAQRPDIACASFFLKAIEMQNVRAAAMLLAYAPHESDLVGSSMQAYSLVTKMQDHEVRHKFLALFEQGHIIKDCPVLQHELLKNARLHELDTVALLLRCGVQPDVGGQNAFLWAVTSLDFEILSMLTKVKLSTSGSSLLAYIEESTAEHDMLRLLTLLAPRGLRGRPLDMHLVGAARMRRHLLVEKMLECGASTEYDDACAIRTAVNNADFTMLGLLLHAKCSMTTVSKAIPDVMALKPFTSRLRALGALLSKGVEPSELERPLQTVLLEHDFTRLDTLELLLRHGAPIDDMGADDNNVILTASRHGDVEALELLCSAGPRLQTINRAVSFALATIHAGQYDVTLGTLKVLLDHGASGEPVNQVLLTALSEDERLDVVRMLLEHGADPNYRDGSAFIVALRSVNSLALLDMLCTFCLPEETSLFAILATCRIDQNYELQALDIVLSSSSHSKAVLNAHWSLELLENMSNRANVVSCFLKHGLDIDMQGGSVLSAVIDAQDTGLLRNILTHRPRLETLKAAFGSAVSLGPRRIGLECMKLLLESAQSAEIGQSGALLRETRIAVTGDFAGLHLLLRHNPDVNHDDGIAVLTAAQSGALKALDLLLPHQPSYSVLKQACLVAAATSLSIEQRNLVCGHLLAANTGLLARNKSSLLVDAITSLPDGIQLPRFLLGQGAKVRPAPLQDAILRCSQEVFVLLLGHCQSANRVDLFAYARAARMDLARRQWVYEALLSDDIPMEHLSDALVETIELDNTQDLSCLKLLLHHGADVGHRDAHVFRLAWQARSFDALRLLTQHIGDDSTAAIVFDGARKIEFNSPQMRLQVYQNLLQWELGQASIDSALMGTVNSTQPDEAVLRLLLARGADPNQDNACCFIYAATTNAESLFKVMSRSADLGLVLQALMAHFQAEDDVFRWAKICASCQSRSTLKQMDNDLLSQCLRKFPNSTDLLGLVLDLGTSSSAMIDHRLGLGWQSEPCTVLLWALFATPRICNEAILLILEKKRHAVLPHYTTPVTGVSAAFACLLDPARTPVLQALLDLDRDTILSSQIPESSMEWLAAPSDSHPGPASGQLVDLCMASLCLGNLGAYRMTNDGTATDDGSLHLAALLALPDFVLWLLQTHDPNLPEEAQDFRIPLAVACSARPQPSCKIANSKADFRDRQQETMQILARRTDLTIRYKGRTVLHLALDDGIETTNSMLAALRVRDDPGWRTKHTFTDNGGQQHTPEEYVKHVLEGTEAHKEALIACLKQAEIVDSVRQPTAVRARSTMTAPGRPGRLSNGARLQRRSSYPHALPPRPSSKRPRVGDVP